MGSTCPPQPPTPVLGFVPIRSPEVERGSPFLRQVYVSDPNFSPEVLLPTLLWKRVHLESAVQLRQHFQGAASALIRQPESRPVVLYTKAGGAFFPTLKPDCFDFLFVICRPSFMK